MSSAEKLPVLLEKKPNHLTSIKIEPIVNSKPPNHEYNKQELLSVNNKEKSEANTQQIIAKNYIQKKFYSCRFCHKSFNQQLDMFEHEWKHSHEKNSGNSVQKEKNFVQKEDIKSEQMNFKQSNVDALYHCNQCNLNFDRKLALKLHQKRIHKSMIHKKSTNSIDTEKIERRNDVIEFIKKENTKDWIGSETLTNGQLISECLFFVFNFPKKNHKNLMSFCPRI